MVPKPKHHVTFSLQPGIPFRIVTSLGAAVLSAIRFNNESSLQTDKVHNIGQLAFVSETCALLFGKAEGAAKEIARHPSHSRVVLWLVE